jgi:hypothetical protein
VPRSSTLQYTPAFARVTARLCLSAVWRHRRRRRQCRRCRCSCRRHHHCRQPRHAATTTAGRRGAPPLTDSGNDTGAWPPGFAYDIDTILPLALPPIGPRTMIGAAFASSSNEGEAVPQR